MTLREVITYTVTGLEGCPELADQDATLVLHLRDGDYTVAKKDEVATDDQLVRWGKGLSRRLRKIRSVKPLDNFQAAEGRFCWACRNPGVQYLATLHRGEKRKVCRHCAKIM